MVVNVADKVERLRRLASEVGKSVVLGFEMRVLKNGNVDSEWIVWDGFKHYNAASPDAALTNAEIAHRLTAVVIPENIEVP